VSAVNLSGANLLPYDEHAPAGLSLHNLKDHALPSKDYLRSLAKLQENRLRGHPSRLTRWVKNRLLRREGVTFTNLTDAKLDDANLTGAILANADLSVTRRQTLNRKQIECAIGNDKTKLPDTDEFKPLPPRWISGEGIEAQIKKVEVQVLEERKKNAVEVWEERIKNTVEQTNEHSNE
jgi:Pentapeptide repeats (8 copies)